MSKVCTFLLAVLSGVLVGCATADRPVARVPDVAAFFPLSTSGAEYLLVYQEKEDRLSLYEAAEHGLVVRASIESPAVPHQAVVLDEHVIVAYGHGRGKLQDPIRIVRYDLLLSRPEELFLHQSERNQVAALIAAPDRSAVFLSFFTSKYDTSAGWLYPDQGSFEEVIGTRLGMHYDVAGDSIVQGRLYGDQQGDDGDVILFSGTGSRRLSSFRGVSAVRFSPFDDDPERDIFIADGWHQHYGQFAEPRVSLLRRQDGAYVLETLAVLDPQHSVSVIHPFTLGQKQYLFVAGNSRADVIDLSDRSVRNLHTSDSIYFNAAFLGQADGQRIRIAIMEEDLWIEQREL